MKLTKHSFTAMAAIMSVIIAVIVILGLRSGYYLVLRNGDTDEQITRFRVNEGDEFSITFIHSVNQYPLTDVYQIKDGKIYVIRTIYNNFGAGVQTEIEEGQTLEINENGEMVVSGFDMEMPYLSYIVGTWSDHTLTIHNQEISLRETCGRNCKVSFSCEHRYF